MKWIKAEITDEAHTALRHRAIDEDKRLDEVAADVLEEATNE